MKYFIIEVSIEVENQTPIRVNTLKKTTIAGQPFNAKIIPLCLHENSFAFTLQLEMYFCALMHFSFYQTNSCPVYRSNYRIVLRHRNDIEELFP
jgi:hypothetical protein